MAPYAILCPGQGTQSPAMFAMAAGADEGRATLAAFSDVVGIDLPARARAGDRLFDNAFAQASTVAATLATWSALEARLPVPAIAAGYSVGEVAAWACAGAWDPTNTARIVVRRAAAMDRYGPSGSGMLAVRGLSQADVVRIAPGVDVAIVNGADDLLVAGTDEALRAAATALAARGAWTRLLDVHVPSHTAVMGDATAAFAATFADLPPRKPDLPVVRGIDGAVLHRADEAPDALARALSEPVRWDACLRTLAERGVSTVLELGPGRSLAGLAAAHAPGLDVRSVDDFRSIDGIVGWLTKRLNG